MQFHVGYFGRVITLERSIDPETVTLKAARSRQHFRERAKGNKCTHFTPLPHSDLLPKLPIGLNEPETRERWTCGYSPYGQTASTRLMRQGRECIWKDGSKIFDTEALMLGALPK